MKSVDRPVEIEAGSIKQMLLHMRTDAKIKDDRSRRCAKQHLREHDPDLLDLFDITPQGELTPVRRPGSLPAGKRCSRALCPSPGRCADVNSRGLAGDRNSAGRSAAWRPRRARRRQRGDPARACRRVVRAPRGRARAGRRRSSSAVDARPGTRIATSASETASRTPRVTSIDQRAEGPAHQVPTAGVEAEAHRAPARRAGALAARAGVERGAVRDVGERPSRGRARGRRGRTSAARSRARRGSAGPRGRGWAAPARRAGRGVIAMESTASSSASTAKRIAGGISPSGSTAKNASAPSVVALAVAQRRVHRAPLRSQGTMATTPDSRLARGRAPRAIGLAAGRAENGRGHLEERVDRSSSRIDGAGPQVFDRAAGGSTETRRPWFSPMAHLGVKSLRRTRAERSYARGGRLSTCGIDGARDGSALSAASRRHAGIAGWGCRRGGRRSRRPRGAPAARPRRRRRSPIPTRCARGGGSSPRGVREQYADRHQRHACQERDRHARAPHLVDGAAR